MKERKNKILISMALSLVSFPCMAQGHWRGDVNLDGKVNIQDVILLVNYLRAGVEPHINTHAADVDKNKIIDKRDVKLLGDIITERVRKKWEDPFGGFNGEESGGGAVKGENLNLDTDFSNDSTGTETGSDSTETNQGNDSVRKIATNPLRPRTTWTSKRICTSEDSMMIRLQKGLKKK